MKLVIMQSDPLPCYLGALRPKYLFQHPILKDPQPMFLPHCEISSYVMLRHLEEFHSSSSIPV